MNRYPKPLQSEKLTALDFFAGSGLVTEGLRPFFDVTWANDVCDKKCLVYRANFGNDHLIERSITEIHGRDVPETDLAWGSFPCQDLSLAGNMGGLGEGSRSGLYWEWLRVLDQMGDRRPAVLCAENVVGFLVADGGAQFKQAYEALTQRGYVAGAFVVDAVHFVPQSRPRSFLVAVKKEMDVAGISGNGPDPTYHPKAVLTAWKAAADPNWIWWKLPPPPNRKPELGEVVELNAPFDPPAATKRLLSMLSPLNREKLKSALSAKGLVVGTGYKRVRWEGDVKRQRLEIRFDGVAGCLRTPEGGSSRQIVLIVKGGQVHTRLLTVREAARLMGARDSFKIPGSYNDGYRAMGDAVVVQVTRWIAKNLLARLCEARPRPERVKELVYA